MMLCRSPGRRRFLELLSSGIAVGYWSSTGPIDLAGADDFERARQILVALFSDLRRVRAVAAAYVGSVASEETSPAALMRAILDDLSISTAAGMTVAAIRGIIAERMRLDFLYNDIVCINGWILSKTEARLCALAAWDMGNENKDKTVNVGLGPRLWRHPVDDPARLTRAIIRRRP
jgi:hypothetical protein